MGTIVVSTNSTLDGVVQDPDGQEGFTGGGWFNQFGGADLKEWANLATEEAMAAQALLLGRRSDQWFGSRWASRPGAWADRLRELRKYVVSSSPVQPVWQNSTVPHGEVLKEVAKLKQKVDGEILVYASYQLARSLLAHGLVDEVRLVILPVILGAGRRLFVESKEKIAMRLVHTQTVGAGLVLIKYRRT